MVIRSRKLADGGESLYLDITHDGKRSYEYLKLYLRKEYTREDKRANKETMALANAIKARRIVEIRNGEFGFKDPERGRVLVAEYIEGYIEEIQERVRKEESNYIRNFRFLMGHIDKYKKNAEMKDVDKRFVKGFISYLRKRKGHSGNMSESSVRTYFLLLGILLNRAVRDGIIDTNPVNQFERKEKPSSKKDGHEFLNIEEVRMLSETECESLDLKRLFLFSCFTGLRYSDMVTLKWKNIVEENGLLHIKKEQVKTKDTVLIPISENAKKWLPTRKGDNSLVFPVPERNKAYMLLKLWAAAAGIKKNVTFHVARHTCATLLLNYGADIYTVSQLLGHSSVNTTQIYAKVLEGSKRKAVELIPKMDKEDI